MTKVSRRITPKSNLVVHRHQKKKKKADYSSDGLYKTDGAQQQKMMIMQDKNMSFSLHPFYVNSCTILSIKGPRDCKRVLEIVGEILGA